MLKIVHGLFEFWCALFVLGDHVSDAIVDDS